MGPIHPVWALAAIHPRWGNRYGDGSKRCLSHLELDGGGMRYDGVGWGRMVLDEFGGGRMKYEEVG